MQTQGNVRSVSAGTAWPRFGRLITVRLAVRNQLALPFNGCSLLWDRTKTGTASSGNLIAPPQKGSAQSDGRGCNERGGRVW